MAGKSPRHSSVNDVTRDLGGLTISSFKVHLRNKVELSLHKGDILKAKADVVVTGEDPGFSGRGGVSQALLKAGGRKYLQQREQTLSRQKTGRPGEVYLTEGGGDLPFPHVLHAVFTPYYQKSPRDDWSAIMAKVYENALGRAVRHQLYTIAMPLLGSGQASCPPDLSIQAALKGLQCVTVFPAGVKVKVKLYTSSDDIEKAALKELQNQCKAQSYSSSVHQSSSPSVSQSRSGASVGVTTQLSAPSSLLSSAKKSGHMMTTRSKTAADKADVQSHASQLGPHLSTRPVPSNSGARPKIVPSRLPSKTSDPNCLAPMSGSPSRYGNSGTLPESTPTMSVTGGHLGSQIHDRHQSSRTATVGKDTDETTSRTTPSGGRGPTSHDQTAHGEQGISLVPNSMTPVGRDGRSATGLSFLGTGIPNGHVSDTPTDERLSLSQHSKVVSSQVSSSALPRERLLDDSGVCRPVPGPDLPMRMAPPTSEVGALPSPPKVDNGPDCAICRDSFTHPRALGKCGHTFCGECIDQAFRFKPVCPSCGAIYGIITGTQPPGSMQVNRMTTSLPGYEGHGTLVINYSFPSGTQQADHPSPGKPYHGTSRQAFLPDSPEGRTILRMLRVSFDRKMTFTIGRSTTTGMEDVVTWNDIHHKTNVSGGTQRFGYPDPSYLQRVKEELESKGIREEDAMNVKCL